MRLEDYDRAKVLKQEIAVLRRNMDARLRPLLLNLGEPGAGAPASPLQPQQFQEAHHRHHQPQPQQQQHQHQHQHPEEQRSYAPASHASTPYDEIPVGGAGAARARAAVYAHAASRGDVALSSSDAAPHHQLHHNSDPIVTGSPLTPFSATAAGGEGGGGGEAAGGELPSPRKPGVPFDEDAPIVGAWPLLYFHRMLRPDPHPTFFFFSPPPPKLK